VAGGVKSADAGPVATSIVGANDYLAGGPGDAAEAFPGNGAPAESGMGGGQAWQKYQPGDGIADEPVMGTEASGHVSGGIRVDHPAAFFPGLGQGV
jgi:hypothetical protein